MDLKAVKLWVFAIVVGAVAVAVSAALMTGCGIRSSLFVEELSEEGGGGGASGDASESGADGMDGSTAGMDSSAGGAGGSSGGAGGSADGIGGAGEDPFCGNGIIDRDQLEQCDGDNLGDETCSSLGYGGGTLTCGPACFYEVIMCEGVQDGSGAYGSGGGQRDGAVWPFF